MKHTVWRLAILAALLLAAIAHPAAKAAPAAESGPMYLVILAPLVNVYEGDTLSLGYMIDDPKPNGGITLAPLTPGASCGSPCGPSRDGFSPPPAMRRRTFRGKGRNGRNCGK